MKSTLAPAFANARSVALAVVLAAGLALSAGCDSRDPVAEAINEATRIFAAVSPNSAPPSSSVQAQAAYNKVVQTLSGVKGQGGPGQQAAAQLLVARAQYGLALAPREAAGQAETLASATIGQARAALGRWVTLSAHSVAMGDFDPAPELAELDTQIRARDAEVRKVTDQRAGVDRQIADLRAKAARALDAQRAEREKENALRIRAGAAAPTEALEIIKQATEHRRRGDAHDVEASTLESQAARLEPESARAALDITRITSQIELLNKAKSQVGVRTALAQERSAAARAAAKAASEEIDARLGEVSQAMAAAEAARSEAISKLDAAASAAASGGEGGKLSKAEAHLAKGTLLLAAAQSLSAQASLLNDLASATPGLPRAAELSAQASEAKSALDDARTAAIAALKEAYESFKAAGGDEEVQAKLTRVRQMLLSAIQGHANGAENEFLSAELAEMAGQAPEPTPDQPAPNAQPERAAAPSPKTTLEEVARLANAGQTDQLLGYFHVTDDQQRQTLAMLVGFGAKIKRLEAACMAKFGQGLGGPLQQMSQMGGGLTGFGDLSVDDLTIDVLGDTATVTSPDGANPMTMKLVNGRWLIDISDQLADPMAAASFGQLGTIGQAIDRITQQVESGALTNQQQVTQALMAALMGGAGFPPPPPGGG